INIAKLFIVDDEISIVNLFEIYLKRKGHKIVAKAHNGEEAIKLFKTLSIRPDIVIMDIRMPIKDGLTAARELCIIDPTCKIIFISADFTMRSQALSIGTAFLEKPTNFPELLALINRITTPFSPVQS
ncbi:MAG: response regulator transcription factor, partial [Candidatus Hodarchaeota archaeon]